MLSYRGVNETLHTKTETRHPSHETRGSKTRLETETFETETTSLAEQHDVGENLRRKHGFCR